MTSQFSIDIDQLNVSYGTRHVLRDLTWRVSPGMTALLGNNGAGKSTLFRSLLRLTKSQSGTVTLLGTTVRNQIPKTLAPRIAWLPQNPTFPKGTTTAHAIAYAAWLKGLDRKQAKSESQRMVELFDLTNVHKQAVTQLSGGQQRKAALACTFSGAPQVVLLDEPTAGLDPSQRESTLSLIRNYIEENAAASVVFSTHLIEDVALAADRISVLAEGRISASHAIDALIPKGADRYSAMRAIRDSLDHGDSFNSGRDA